MVVGNRVGSSKSLLGLGGQGLLTGGSDDLEEETIAFDLILPLKF